ncbi:MAG: hypothetical protein HXS52_05395 [Theionarchaea archaeon]|nr:hypothetical protein [Theionarchaea archaeon]
MVKGRKTDNLTMRICLEVVERIAGPNGLKSVLNYAHLEKYIENPPPDNDEIVVPVEDVKTLYMSLMELFGQKGARGLQLRVGREFMCIGRDKRQEISKDLNASLQSASATERMKFTLKVFTEQFEQRWTSGSGKPRFELQEDVDHILVVDKDNPLTEDIESQAPMCFATVGMLQELLNRAMGNLHDVVEVECRAMGHPADVFRISKACNAD